MVFERVKKPKESDSYMDFNDDCSTEMGGFRSHYGAAMNMQANN